MRNLGLFLFYVVCWPGAMMRSEMVGYPTPRGTMFWRWGFNIFSILTIIGWWIVAAFMLFVVLPWLSIALAD